MMKMFAWCFVLFFSVTALISAGEMNPTDCQENVVVALEKVYLDPSQVYITSEGIFFLNNQGVMEVASGLFYDKEGLFAIQKAFKCKYCGWVLTSDYRCINPNCRLNQEI